MSNYEKANALARKWIDSMGGLSNINHIYGDDVGVLIYTLRDAGLLAPDLPEPDSHDENGWPEWGDTEYMTYFSEHPCKGIPYINCPLGEGLSTDMARREAYRLLAAAEWLDNWDKEHINE